jgi:plasmid stabilization system protein ParE
VISLVETTPVADVQIEAVNHWWVANRLAAPTLFASELATCFDLLARQPYIGRPYRRTTISNVRRVLLRASRYHVYYVAEPERVLILAVWHAQRGVGPDLAGA